MFDRIAFANGSWWWPALLFWLTLMALSIVSYWRSRLSLPRALLGLVLRSVGLGLLLLCWLDPIGTLERAKPQANLFAVLVDKSQSMTAALHDESGSRLKNFQSQLLDESNWQRKLADEFRLRRYVFDSSVQPVDTWMAMKFDGATSSLDQSIQSLRDRFQDRPIAGLLLFSDGNSTDSAVLATESSNIGFPIYPVRVGQSSTIRDLRIASLTTRQSDFEASPVTITATLAQRGLTGQVAVIELLDQESQVVQSQKLTLVESELQKGIEFRFRPTKPGIQGYRLWTHLESENPRLPSSMQPNETNETLSSRSVEITIGNNQRHQVVDRGRGPYRILYVAGRPNWEHKFLRRALDEDDEIELVSLVRIAKKEPKFSFRDNRVDSSNPLFSGFEDISAEEKEQYDQPVFARIGVDGEDHLKGGFPKSVEELFAYHAIILDDLEHDFFTQDQQSLLRQYVSSRGGGLLVLGGQESMRGQGFKNSVLSQLLPVYGEDGPSTDAGPPSVTYQLTREGWLSPFMRSADNEVAEKLRLEKMPKFEVLNQTRDIKPGASVLAEVLVDADTKLPALVTQRFGKGRTASLMIGDMWRWGMHHEGKEEAPLFQAWRQMIRWLISDVPKRTEMSIEPSANGGRASRVVVTVRDHRFEALDNAKVEVEWTTPDGKTSKGLAEASTRKAGEYELTIVPEAEGVYMAVASITALDGMEIGSIHAGWVYEPSSLEFSSIGENEDRLEQLASSSGGEVIELDGLENFVDDLPTRKVPVTEIRAFPIWHQSWVLFLGIACLCGEWAIRRWSGLS